MISFSEYLNEALFDIDSAVDYIFDTYYADYFKKLEKLHGGLNVKLPKRPQSVLITSGRLARLSNNKAITVANLIKPVTINIEGRNNSFNPMSSTVSIRMSQFVDFMESMSVKLELADRDERAEDIFANLLRNSKEQRSFREDYRGEKLKNSIAHELSHWLNDTKNNRNIFNKLMKAKDKNSSIEVLQGLDNVALTDIERDAQIHQIAQMKRKIPDVLWDSYSFEEMLTHDNSLYSAIWLNLSKKDQHTWKKLILRRMRRENLLGKKMR